MSSRQLSASRSSTFNLNSANQEEADRDIPKLLTVPARVHFLSMEPPLGPVDLAIVRAPHWARTQGMNVLTGETNPSLDGIAPAATVDWVIVGGESGASARPMHPDWARSLRNQCAAAGVPFLFKQWGEWAPRGPESLGYPVDEPKGIARVRINTAGENDAFLTSVNGHTPRWMQMSGKKRAGRLLDGVQHDRFPEITA
jgi:protein gp37